MVRRRDAAAFQQLLRRSPHGERHCARRDMGARECSVTSLPARGATRGRSKCRNFAVMFCYVAPRTGSDRLLHGGQLVGYRSVTSLPARGATRLRCLKRTGTASSVTSLPARGATIWVLTDLMFRVFQPTLPARGATAPAGRAGIVNHISTHAPRTGSDEHWIPVEWLENPISTHAPRTGSDATKTRVSGSV